MKKKSIIISLLMIFALSGCSNGKSGGENDPFNPTKPDDFVEPENTTINSISLDKSELDLVVGKGYNLIVNFDPEDLTLEQKGVIWASSDSAVATVSQYGQVKAVKAGDAIISCTTEIDNVVAYCRVYVFNSESDKVTRYERVDDLSTLKAGDIVTIGCPQKGLIATNTFVGAGIVPTTITYSNDGSYITGDMSNADTYLLSGSEDLWQLENKDNKLLAAHNLKNIDLVNKKGNTRWMFEFNEKHHWLGIMSSSNVPGWLMFNTKANLLTLYETESELIDMFFPTLYRYTIVR